MAAASSFAPQSGPSRPHVRLLHSSPKPFDVWPYPLLPAGAPLSVGHGSSHFLLLHTAVWILTHWSICPPRLDIISGLLLIHIAPFLLGYKAMRHGVLAVVNIVVLPLEIDMSQQFWECIGRYLIWEQKIIDYWEFIKIACTLLFISHLPRKIQTHSLSLYKSINFNS
jgi:hypothetical protein